MKQGGVTNFAKGGNLIAKLVTSFKEFFEMKSDHVQIFETFTTSIDTSYNYFIKTVHQNDHNMCISHLLEDIFLLDTAHLFIIGFFRMYGLTVKAIFQNAKYLSQVV